MYVWCIFPQISCLIIQRSLVHISLESVCMPSGGEFVLVITNVWGNLSSEVQPPCDVGRYVLWP